MEKYDYRKQLCQDIRTWIGENYTKQEFINAYNQDPDDLVQELNDKMWIEDSVTGNTSGSYTFNTWEAEENICHNFDLLEEACEEFGSGVDVLKSGAEACDVTIRCYLLGECIGVVFDEIVDDHDYSMFK